MMWLAVPALALMLAATVQGNQCKNPKDIPRALFTPEFDFEENLSFKECGKWPDKSKAAPWRIAVGRQDGATCFGVLLSNYNFITSQCTEVANDFRKDPSNVKAHTGLCYDQKLGSGDATTDCKLNNQGLELEIKSVEVLGDDPETQLHLWQLAKILKNTNPICLFNRNRQHSGGYSGEPKDYNMYDRKWIGKYAVKLGGAPKSADAASVELCVKTSSCQNAPTDRHDFSGDFLVIEVNNRLLLRGFFFWPIFDGRFFTYTDVVPFIKELVTKSHDMFLMPEIPRAKTKTDFRRATSLNDLRVCGIRQVLKSRYPGRPRPSPKKKRESNRAAADFLMGGQPSKVAEHPWHASITYHQEEMEPKYDFCGATLISKRALITAAHCMFDPISKQLLGASQFQIALGMNSVSSLSEDSMRQFLMVGKAVLHPNYNPEAKVNDVALLLLDEDVNITKYVTPICLWDEDYDLEKIQDKNGTVVGWGYTDKKLNRPDKLQVGKLLVRSHRDCYLQEQQFFGKYLKPGVNFCAGGPTGDNAPVAACQGDSGGSLVIDKNSQWFLRGVVSFGISIKNDQGKYVCDEKFPSLYADLAYSMDWIVDEVAKHQANNPA